MTRKERLKKLAEKIGRIAEKDRKAIEQSRQIAALRCRSAMTLYAICSAFVEDVNHLAAGNPVTLDPPQYSPATLDEGSPTLFQINVRGRILQIEFSPTDELLSTEEYRQPYTLEGEIRCFNQELLEKALVEEQLLYCCVETDSTGQPKGFWRYIDARTYKTGPFDEDYLISVMENLID